MMYFTRILGELYGRIWFYEDANVVAYHEAQLSLHQVATYYAIVSTFMCYDYESVALAGEVFDDTSCIMLAEAEIGVAMPSTAFIAMYQSGRNFVDTIDRERQRREIRYQIICIYVDDWHK
jgi:hypothetical protein